MVHRGKEKGKPDLNKLIKLYSSILLGVDVGKHT